MAAVEGIPVYLAFRVVDNNTGAEIIRELPHMHQASWTVRGLAKGLAGLAGLGNFRIPLFPLWSDDYRAYAGIYAKLAPGQRIEGYTGPVGSGAPLVSGYVMEVRRTLTGPHEISGMDSMFILQQSPVLPGEMMRNGGSPGGYGADMVRQMLTGLEVVFDDRMSGTLANYSITPAGSWTATTDPYIGATAFTCSTVGSECLALNTTVHASADYTDAHWTATFLTINNTDASVAGEAGLMLGSDATGQNAILVRGVARNVSNTAVWDGEIWTRAAGVWTRQMVKSSVVTFPPWIPSRIQLTASIYHQGNNVYIHLYLNGSDCGSWLYSTTGVYPSGQVGLRWSVNNSGAAQVWAESISWRKRSPTPRFVAGTLTTGTQAFNGLAHYYEVTALDLISQAAATDGYFVRKTPKAGYKADVIDYQAAPGVDRSTQVIFTENDNLVELDVTSNAESFGYDLAAYAQPGGDSGGRVIIPASGNVGDLSLRDAVVTPGATLFAQLQQIATRIQATKASPGLAKIATVLRDPITADTFRELDYITIDAPGLNLPMTKVLVLGYTIIEGEVVMQLEIDAYSAGFGSAVLQGKRTAAALRQIAANYATR